MKSIQRNENIRLLHIIRACISYLLLLRGVFVILTIVEIVGVLKDEMLVQIVVSHFAFLAAGIVFAVGAILNWKEIKINLTLD